ncbi:MAG: MerR family transcriptional regulator [Veillonellaceae bacterium]|nr:MerR family transcriptional regulator [Veillonellaceae bacterium]
MLQLNFWISELAARIGVSTRTIRYYVEQGLLPQPEIQGKYAVFNEDYLVRLKLIKYLKDAYLPLREIKRKLDSLMVPEMHDLLRRFEQDPSRALAELDIYPVERVRNLTPASDEEESSESAHDYIQRTLRRQPSTIREKPMVFNAAMPAPRSAPEPAAESWQRVDLAPGVELNIRQPQPQSMRVKLAEVIELARKILSR